MWFDAPPEQRLVAWRQWRQSLQNCSLEQIANSVAKTWSMAPLSAHYLTPDDPTQWPTPWQLIYDNIYCDLACTLGMFHSVALLPCAIDVKLKIYLDNSGWINLLSLEHEKYILNWNHGTVVNTTMTANPVAQRVWLYSYNRSDLAGKF